MKGKIIVLLVSMALLVGILSGCTQTEPETTNTAPEASFTYTVNGTTMTATFTDASSDADGDTLTYSWDFGDDETSTDQNPEHVYAENGSYTVVLTVDDGTETATSTQTVEVNVVAPTMPTASFTYDPMADITTTTEINFTDVSTLGDATSLTYSWDFDGDGVEDSVLQNPTHTYAAAGTYNVTLTVTDETDTTLTDVSDVTSIEVTAATT